MPDNGVVRVASNFENDFREFNGRPPTAEETKRHLAFDRLAKTSNLDPATVLLIVDAGRTGGTEKALEAICERLERVEQGVDDLKAQKANPNDLGPLMARLAEQLRYAAATSAQADPLSSVMWYVLAFVVGGLVCEALFFAATYGVLSARVFDRLGMYCLGLSTTALVLGYLWLAPLVRKRGRRG